MSSSSSSVLVTLAKRYSRTLPSYSYGTSGFRGLAETLPSVCFRMGMLAAIRSLSFPVVSPARSHHSSYNSTGVTPHTAHPVIGVMVTASHNDEPDNGVKLADPTGEMMAQEWEALATQLANASEEDIESSLKELLQQFHINTDYLQYASQAMESKCAAAHAPSPASSSVPRVFIGRDTRPSSEHLSSLVSLGARCLGAEVVDFGVVTTPQLHWLVKEFNDGRVATVERYYETLAAAFKTALNCREGAPSASTHALLSPLIVDCANGVGSLSLQALAKRIDSELKVELRNIAPLQSADEKKGVLNHQCGAEYVQKTRGLPVNFDEIGDRGKKLAAIDGDSDRLVYFYVRTEEDGSHKFRLLDGDKIIALYTLFLRDLIKSAELDLSIGIVQTAYANGASTIYMTNELQMPVQCTPTGVKYLHHKAAKYDVGVYFESNGHGTVLFSEKAIKSIKQAAHNSQVEKKKHQAARCLAALVELVNQCVGDAVSDLLLVEVALYHLDWPLSKWDSLYEDLPSSMLKVKVKDRNVITTTDAERKCVTPAGLQDEIDKIVQNGPGGVAGVRRSFVRPSGTEDVVRVYAEAASREEVDTLAKQVCEAVAKLAGGI